MILTNRFNVTYDYEKMDRDYDIFQVEKPEYLDKTNILDLATRQFQVGQCSTLSAEQHWSCLIRTIYQRSSSGMRLGQIILMPQ